jgi:hypothetical protein
MQDSVPRYIGAFLKSLKSLQGYYDYLKSSPSPDTLFHFPYPCEYMPLDTSGSAICQSFQYLGKLHPSKLVFQAMHGDSHICVKFVRRYSKEAHIKCASLGAAPSLRGYEILPGGWIMVIMDFLDQESYEPMTTSHHSYFPAIHSIVENFHQAGFVHGDLRSSNILVRSEEGPNPIALLDFDWSGKAGEACYPFKINRKSVRRPDAVRGGQLILADHDKAMLDLLFNGTDVENVPDVLWDVDSISGW